MKHYMWYPRTQHYGVNSLTWENKIDSTTFNYLLYSNWDLEKLIIKPKNVFNVTAKYLPANANEIEVEYEKRSRSNMPFDLMPMRLKYGYIRLIEITNHALDQWNSRIYKNVDKKKLLLFKYNPLN